MNKEMILRVAEAIETESVPELGFDMSEFVMTRPDCGTVACIAGWTVALYHGVEHGRDLYQLDCDMQQEASEILDIDYLSSNSLFVPCLPDMKMRNIPRSWAVRVLRHLARTGEVNWAAAVLDAH